MSERQTDLVSTTERKQRLDEQLNARQSDKINIVDSHFHLDILQERRGEQNLNVILSQGQQPYVPVNLDEAVTNLCYLIPDRATCHRIKADKHLAYIHMDFI